MIRTILPALLLVVLLAFGRFCHYSIVNGVREIEVSAAAIGAAVAENDWETADYHMELALEGWNGYTSFYSLIARHEVFEQVDRSIRHLQELLKTRDVAMCLAPAYELRELLNIMADSEDFRWENIF